MIEQDFFDSIDADPNDIAPVLAFADWLKTRGDERAELLRLIVAGKFTAEGHLFDLVEAIEDECGRRLFACDCAERVLHLFEREFPADGRPRRVIGTARRFAIGKATKEELAAARQAVSESVNDARGKRSASWAVWPVRAAAEEHVDGTRAAWSAECAIDASLTNADKEFVLKSVAGLAERRWQKGRASEYAGFKRGVTPLFLHSQKDELRAPKPFLRRWWKKP